MSEGERGREGERGGRVELEGGREGERERERERGRARAREREKERERESQRHLAGLERAFHIVEPLNYQHMRDLVAFFTTHGQRLVRDFQQLDHLAAAHHSVGGYNDLREGIGM